MSSVQYSSAMRLLPGALAAVFIFSTAFGSQAFAQGSSAAVPFLQIEPDSRSAAMGNANVALADNAYAMFWNPAGLGIQRGAEASITHSPWLSGLTSDLFYDYLVGKYHIPGWGTVGAHLTYLNLGEHEARDATGEFLGNFRAYDIAAGASYGVAITDKFSVGTGLRFIYSNLAPGQIVDAQETRAGVSAGVDLGLLYHLPTFSIGAGSAQPTLGLSIANMGPRMTYSDGPQADPIPTNLRAGWSMRFDFDQYNSLTLVNDFNKMLIHRDSEGVAAPFHEAFFKSWESLQINVGTPGNPQYRSLSALEQMTIGAGLEYWYDNMFAVRSGYFYEHPDNGNRQFLTLGAGIRYNILGVDFSYLYALEDKHPLSNTMRFSLLLNFGQ